MREFYVHCRKSGVFYVEFVDPVTHKKTTARSTGERDRDAALGKAWLWLRDGIPTSHRGAPRLPTEIFDVNRACALVKAPSFTNADALRLIQALKDAGHIDSASVAQGPSAELFVDYLAHVWDYEQSPYVRKKLVHGQSIGRRHCYECLNKVRRYWGQFEAFKGLRLSAVTKKMLEVFGESLVSSGLKKTTVQKILNVGTVALQWAHDERILQENPATTLVKYTDKATERGVLTMDEADRIFSVQWDDERACVANLLAAATGMRAGEVLALRGTDIIGNRLEIRRAWSPLDGEKLPKTNKYRTVPLPSNVCNALLELSKKSPYGVGGFLFHSTLENKPMDHKALGAGLEAALAKIGITPTERRRRAVTFHSWRHFYAARMADRLDQRTVQLATGHNSAAVFNVYAAHETENDLRRLADTSTELFGGFGVNK